ncbi:MAG TPA: hypothetical protein ENJ79_07350 [Gammaproteobacteria bacterium]|nr:hypothetical protein [Gammaproteobacteria bacterium]
MPYFVYRIQPGPTKLLNSLEKLDQFDSFKEARTLVRSLRAEQATDDTSQYKVIFADSELHAEELLQEKREAPILREWEK